MNQTAGSWDAFATAYSQSVRIRDDAFHLGPNGAALDPLQPPLDVKSDDDVLDLGCGSGENARAIAPACRSVVAVDSSTRQIQRALERPTPANLEYQIADMHTYVQSAEGSSFDLIYSVFACEYVADLRALMRECARTLRVGGRFLYCDLHPTASCADVVGATPNSFIESAAYFDEGPRVFAWPHEPKASEFVRYHRSLATLVDSGLRAGLDVRAILEPTTSLSHESSPYHDGTIAEQHDVWSRIPYTLALVFERR